MSDGKNAPESDQSVEMPVSAAPDADTSHSPQILLREKADEDRRGSKRRSYYVGVHVATDREEVFGLTGNISAGGLHVVTDDLPSLGDVVELDFLLEGDETLVVRGEVRWVRPEWDREAHKPPGFGVEFGEFDATEKDRLARLLDSLDWQAQHHGDSS